MATKGGAATSQEDDDFYDADGLLDIIPEDTADVDQADPSEDGIDDDFLRELGKAKSTPFKRPLKYFIFLLKGLAKKGVRIINLPHPKTGNMAKFVLNSEGSLLEIQKSGELCSWFLNDKSIEDGGVFLTSDIDPIFLMLPILDKARKAKVGTPGVFLPPVSLFEEVDASVSRRFKPFVPVIDAVCDVRTQGNDKFYRLNDDKVVVWLQHKLDALCEALEKNLEFSSTLVRAHASNYHSRNTQKLTVTEMLKLGVGFLGEYVEKKWITALESKIGISNADLLAAANAAVAKKSYASEEEVAPRKRAIPHGGFDDDLSKETTTPTKKKVNRVQASLAKVDKRGMSPITSFFKVQAKPKPEESS